MTTSAANAVEKKEEKQEKRRALGRGLESLLPGPRVVAPIPRVPSPEPSVGGTLPSGTDAGVAAPEVISMAPQSGDLAGHDIVTHIRVDAIEKNPYQTRLAFDEQTLIEMRDSIKEHGVVQPVVVRPAEEPGHYILVLGERRLRASKMAGKDTIPALVRRLSPQQAAEMTVLENVVREDLNCLEQAEAYRVLSQEFHLTQAQIAERIGVSRESVANYMRLLRLPEKVKRYMLEDRLTFSDARQLLALESAEQIEKLAEEVVTNHLKWDEIENRVARLNGLAAPDQNKPQSRGARWVDPNVRAAQTEMERVLGLRVWIKDRQGKGKIVIEYASVDDYERVVELFRGKQ